MAQSPLISAASPPSTSKRLHVWRILLPIAVLSIVGAVWSYWHFHIRPEAVFSAALSALKQRNLRQVSKAAERLKAETGFVSHAHLLRGAVLLRSGRPQFALRELSQLQPEGELLLPALELTGECLYRLGRLTEAEFVMRRLVHDQPGHVDAHRWLGSIYFDLGAYTAAIEEFKKVAELAPTDFAPHRIIGLMNHEFELNAEAIEHYRKALALSPPRDVRQEILRELAKTLVAERQYEAALECVETADADATVLALRGECCWSLGRHEEARKYSSEASSLGPDERLPVLLEARIALTDGRIGDAIAALQRALQRNAHDAECRYQLALSHRQQGDREKYDVEMARWKESTDLHTRLTRLNIDAIERPRDAVVRDQLAEVCEALGRRELAAMWRHAAESCRTANAARAAVN